MYSRLHKLILDEQYFLDTGHIMVSELEVLLQIFVLGGQ
jgi:hypothetical protein